MASPLFIFGVARSGTNLIAGMLNAHSRIALALDPLMPFFKSLRDAWIAKANRPALLARYPAGCSLQDYYYGPSGIDLLDLVMSANLDVNISDPKLTRLIAVRAAIESPQLAKRLENLTGNTYRAMLDEILSCISPKDDDDLLWHGTKEVWTCEFIPALAHAYPDAQFILIRRDPRGVIASLLEMMRKDPDQAAHTVSYMRHWRKETAVANSLMTEPTLAKRIHLVRYEDLAAHPDDQLKLLADFLGITVEPSMLSPIMGEGGGKSANSSYGEFEGISNLSVSRWQRVLEPAMVRTIEYVCGPEMAAMGYKPVHAVATEKDPGLIQTFEAANNNPGSWRSDTGTPTEELAHETARRNLLNHPESTPFNTDEIRRNFLFLPFFTLLNSTIHSAR